ncbi:MAG: hypothetical protein CSA24_00295 [Deltaproteobacteria bacterium]|nr:MAG: hypothetical protein CSB49_03910 [Pseudomonadota bacterium]PIE66391.1 MAG: hypothetical protein CSA24_00295 [Deltaproteobacteria bacterium]
MNQPEGSPTPNDPQRSSDALLLLAFLLSGTAGLGYEILWTRLLGVALGSEILAIFGVLAGFFLGLAVGAFALQRRARRARNPLFLFATLELIAAAYAIVSPRLLYWLADSLAAFGGGQSSGLALLRAVAISAISLLPATVCLGGTLAAMVEARRRARPDDPDGRGIGRLYGANTLGAMLGTLVAVYLVLPALGFAAGSFVLALCGAGAAAAALLWGRRVGLAEAPSPVNEEDEPSTSRADALEEEEDDHDDDDDAAKRHGFPRWALFALVFGTGFVGVGFEAVGVKVLAQGLENTIFSFANILAVYLGGTAVGAWLYARFAGQLSARRFAPTLGWLLVWLAVAVVLAAIPLRYSPEILASVAPPSSGYLRQLFGELVIAFTVFGVPTLLMGALFSHIVGALSDRAAGYAYGLNTLGATLAPFVFGLLAVPKMQYTGAYYLAAYGYLALFAVFVIFGRRRLVLLPIAIIAVVALDFAAPASLSLVHPPAGWRLLDRQEGLFGAVLVIEREGAGAAGKLHRRLQLGRRFRMGGQRAFGERRMGHMPLLLSQSRKNVLFLGVGTGATLGATRSYPIERVDAVELVPEIIGALKYFSAINAGIHKDPGVHLHAGDARRFVARAPRQWNLIVADLFHPARDGAAALFSLEHFQTIERKLAPKGVFVQWIPLYQFAPDDLKLVVRTFLAAFEQAHSFIGLYNAQNPIMALVGYRPGPGAARELRIDLEQLRRELKRGGRARYVQDARDLLGSYLLDHAALKRFAGEGPLNTDLTPRLTFSAPIAAYERGDELAWSSLATLLPLRTPCPDSLFGHKGAAADKHRRGVKRWAKAVSLYMEADLMRVRAGAKQYPAGAVRRLLDAYDIEPSFLPSRGLLLSIARGGGPDAARIYRRLMHRTPNSFRVRAAYVGHLKRSGRRAEAQRFQQEMQRVLQRQRQRQQRSQARSPQ